jgi:hypothetical protein
VAGIFRLGVGVDKVHIKSECGVELWLKCGNVWGPKAWDKNSTVSPDLCEFLYIWINIHAIELGNWKRLYYFDKSCR